MAEESPNPRKARQMMSDDAMAQPWGENLRSKSLKKTHFTEHKKEKQDLGRGQAGFFPFSFMKSKPEHAGQGVPKEFKGRSRSPIPPALQAVWLHSATNGSEGIN